MSESFDSEPALAVVALSGERLLSAVRFQSLAVVPPELERFASISNKSTRRAYENALQDFMRFIGISRPSEFREMTRSHVIAWRDDLASRGLSSQTLRHRLAALFSEGQGLHKRAARIRYARPQQPTRSTIRSSSPRCRSS